MFEDDFDKLANEIKSIVDSNKLSISVQKRYDLDDDDCHNYMSGMRRTIQAPTSADIIASSCMVEGLYFGQRFDWRELSYIRDARALKHVAQRFVRNAGVGFGKHITGES